MRLRDQMYLLEEILPKLNFEMQPHSNGVMTVNNFNNFKTNFQKLLEAEIFNDDLQRVKNSNMFDYVNDNFNIAAKEAQKLGVSTFLCKPQTSSI